MPHRWSYPDARILVVDDKYENLYVVQELLKEAGYTQVSILQDPGMATDVVLGGEVDLVLLDLHMPVMSGYDILQMLRDSSSSAMFVPVLAFTADSTPEARKRALDLGAYDFITKPFDTTELLLRVRNFLRMRQMHLALVDETVALEAEVAKRTKELVQARTEALDCLSRAGEFRDDATGEHARRVGNVSADIARAMELDPEFVESLRLAAPLHDVGKIGIPDAVLLKCGKLDLMEYSQMKTHTTVGETIIGPCSSPLLRLARQIAMHHHECWDGSGYPEGLSGHQIPIACRIVAVADVFDALIHDRPYKKAWTREEAIREIQSLSGKKFDPQVVAAFVSIQQPVGR